MAKSYTDKVDALKAAVQKEAQKGQSSQSSDFDDMFWKATVVEGDKTSYTVRFLPRQETESGLPYIKMFTHYIRHNGELLVRPCPKRVELPCPICEHCGTLYNTGNPLDSEQASKWYRKTGFMANIFVREDERDKGANEGKVFIWRYGVKVNDMITEAMSDPDLQFYYDPFAGFDFIITVISRKNFMDYSSSRFAHRSTPLAETEAEMDEILDQAYNLHEEFLTEDYYQDYDEMALAFEEHIGQSIDTKATVQVEAKDEDLDDLAEEIAKQDAKKASTGERDDPEPVDDSADLDIDAIQEEIENLDLDDLDDLDDIEDDFFEE